MQQNEYRSMYELEDHYWWFVGRWYILNSILRRNINLTQKLDFVLDYGCGTGSNLLRLSKLAYRVAGVDTSQEAIDFCRERGITNAVRINSSADLPNVLNQKAQLITVLDVLEHIDNTHQVLSDLHNALDSDGMILVSVPAYQFLWSDHDIALHHHRRYSKAELASQLETAGFKIKQITFAITFLFPVIAIYRLINKVFPVTKPKGSYVKVPKQLNIFFINLLQLEGFLIKKGLRFPFGVSIIAFATRGNP